MQLDLIQKEQVRAAAPKSARTAKNLFCSMRYWLKLFLIIHELSVPAQTAVNGSLMQSAKSFGRRRSRSPRVPR